MPPIKTPSGHIIHGRIETCSQRLIDNVVTIDNDFVSSLSPFRPSTNTNNVDLFALTPLSTPHMSRKPRPQFEARYSAYRNSLATHSDNIYGDPNDMENGYIKEGVGYIFDGE